MAFGGTIEQLQPASLVNWQPSADVEFNLPQIFLSLSLPVFLLSSLLNILSTQVVADETQPAAWLFKRADGERCERDI